MAPTASPLEGRDAELSRLRACLEDAQNGRGGVVLLQGEAGIGKSALATALAEDAKRAGCCVEWGRAWELAEAPAWFPVRACLRSLGIDLAALPTSELEVFGLWEQVLESLARTSARAPTVWVVEDLHAADARTLELLAYLAQPLRALPVLLLGTVRTGEARLAGPAEQRLNRLGRDGTVIDLPRLEAPAVAALVERIAGRSLPPERLDTWMERTAGNPLFVVECARALRTPGSTTQIPATVIHVVQDRLATLPATSREVLEHGAVLGRDFSAAMLAQISRRLPALVIDALLPVLKTGLLDELAPGRFRFGHALVRDAIEQSMTPDARRAAHARAMSALAALGETADHSVDRAGHALEALGAVPEAEVVAAVDAAVAALERHASPDRAYGLWRRLHEVQTQGPRAERLLHGARLALRAGMFAEARRHCEAALALARASGDVECFAEAALELGANLRPATIDPLLVSVLEEAARQLLGRAQPALECRVRARLAAAMQPARDPLTPVTMAREAIEMARQLGRSDVLREVLFVGGSALIDYAPLEEIQRVSREVLETALAAEEPERAIRAFIRLAAADLALGDLSAFSVGVDRMLGLGRSIGHPRLLWRPLIMASMRAVARGRFAESERLLEEVDQLARLTDDPALGMTLMAHRAYRVLTMDRHDDAIKLLAVMGPTLSATAGAALVAPSVRALFAVRFEDAAAAAPEIPLIMGHLLDPPNGMTFWSTLGQAVALAGTAEQREHVKGRLAPFAELHDHSGHVPHSYEGSIARVVALLEASLGEHAQAVARFDRAIERARTHDLLPWIARMQLERARSLSALGREAESGAAIEEVIAIASALPLPAMEVRARALRVERKRPSDAAGPASPPPAPASRAPVTLALEGEVWRVSLGDRTTRVRDSRGMQLLARLVSSPEQRILALALVAGDEGVVLESDAGEMLDATALREYRARLRDLEAEIEEATRHRDRGRLAILDREREFLNAELSRALGLGGRVRPAGSATERARVNVTRRLKEAISRIAEADRAIGTHLEVAVRTGTYCSYRP